jgi:hypothetical protein
VRGNDDDHDHDHDNGGADDNDDGANDGSHGISNPSSYPPKGSSINLIVKPCTILHEA